MAGIFMSRTVSADQASSRLADDKRSTRTLHLPHHQESVNQRVDSFQSSYGVRESERGKGGNDGHSHTHTCTHVTTSFSEQRPTNRPTHAGKLVQTDQTRNIFYRLQTHTHTCIHTYYIHTSRYTHTHTHTYNHAHRNACKHRFG